MPSPEGKCPIGDPDPQGDGREVIDVAKLSKEEGESCEDGESAFRPNAVLRLLGWSYIPILIHAYKSFLVRRKSSHT